MNPTVEHGRPTRIERIGGALVLVGAAVWVYGIVWRMGGAPRAAHFLPVHPCGALPGAVLARWQEISGWSGRSR